MTSRLTAPLPFIKKMPLQQTVLQNCHSYAINIYFSISFVCKKCNSFLSFLASFARAIFCRSKCHPNWQARHGSPHSVVFGHRGTKALFTVSLVGRPSNLFFFFGVAMQSIRLFRPAANIQRTPLYLTQCGGACSQRFISYSARRFDQEKSSTETNATEQASEAAEATEAAPESPSRPPTRRKAFFRWLEKDGARFRNIAQGTTNYMGSRASYLNLCSIQGKMILKV